MPSFTAGEWIGIFIGLLGLALPIGQALWPRIDRQWLAPRSAARRAALTARTEQERRLAQAYASDPVAFVVWMLGDLAIMVMWVFLTAMIAASGVALGLVGDGAGTMLGIAMGIAIWLFVMLMARRSLDWFQRFGRIYDHYQAARRGSSSATVDPVGEMSDAGKAGAPASSVEATTDGGIGHAEQA